MEKWSKHVKGTSPKKIFVFPKAGVGDQQH